MHSKAMWPIHGRYVCPDCHREYPVAWEATPPAVEYTLAAQAEPRHAENALSLLFQRSLFQRSLFQRAGLKRSDTL
jgi:hypothetical protein